MSSTRKAEGNTLNQERWCSSPELSEGLVNAFMAAKRIALIECQDIRELLWFIQWRSVKAGGIKALAGELVRRFPERVGTPLLRRWAQEQERALSQSEVNQIREELPRDGQYLAVSLSDIFWDTRMGQKEEEHYSTSDFTRPLAAALNQLPEYLQRLCLDPSLTVTWKNSPWCFQDIMGALKQIRDAEISEAKQRLANTEISRQMNASLDFCYRRRRMVFIEGAAGIGRTVTLQAWCDAHGGMVRYVETPSSNDDRSFYAKMAEALGVARGTSYNGQQIKLRVEETLSASGLVIALDEAQYLWPQYNRPRSIPSRLLWVKTAFDAGTPFAIVAHSDFSKWQKLYVEKTMWTDEQWERRLNRKVFLPAQHSEEDMMLIAQKKFPEGDKNTWMLLTGYALAAEKKQASAITELLESARDRAEQDGRTAITFEDVDAAIQGDHLPVAEMASCRSVASPVQPVCKRNARAIQGTGRDDSFSKSAAHRRPIRPVPSATASTLPVTRPTLTSVNMS